MKMSLPWEPHDATQKIRSIAQHRALALSYKVHAIERLAERNIFTTDVLFVLKNGFVYEPAAHSTLKGFYKYLVQGLTPNSGGRKLGLVVIPDDPGCAIKIVTVMWMDEMAVRAGTLMEDTK